MEQRGRGRAKHRLLGNHQKCWLWGRNAVLETLKAGRWPVLDLCLSSELPEDDRASATRRARQLGTPLSVETPETLTRLCHSTEHQGYLARMAEFPYATEDQVLHSAGPAPALVILDGLQDPHNLGAVVRSTEVFGLDGVFIGTAGQTGVTSMVARSSSGAVNRVPIARVEGLAGLVERLKLRGIRVIAASEKASVPLMRVDFKPPTAIVLGNEGVGISASVLAACSEQVHIPQYGCIGSLNAAVAAGIFFYELRCQRGAPAPGRPPAA